MNIDAYVSSGLFHGLGAVIRDENGCILVGGVRKIQAAMNAGDNVIKMIEQRIEGASPIHLFYYCIVFFL